jgi:hypothetical protein
MDKASLRHKALERWQIIDIESIGELVRRGEIVFSRRILLSALIECNDDVRRQILEQVTDENFPESWFRVIFETTLISAKIDGKVNKDELYRAMEHHVRDHWPSKRETDAKSGLSAEDVLPGYLAVIDHILAIEMPDKELIEMAILNVRRFSEWRKQRDAKLAGSESSLGRPVD